MSKRTNADNRRRTFANGHRQAGTLTGRVSASRSWASGYRPPSSAQLQQPPAVSLAGGCRSLHGAAVGQRPSVRRQPHVGVRGQHLSGHHRPSMVIPALTEVWPFTRGQQPVIRGITPEVSLRDSAERRREIDPQMTVPQAEPHAAILRARSTFKQGHTGASASIGMTRPGIMRARDSPRIASAADLRSRCAVKGRKHLHALIIHILPVKNNSIKSCE